MMRQAVMIALASTIMGILGGLQTVTGATVHVRVSVPDIYPQNIAVNVGDTVVWTRIVFAAPSHSISSYSGEWSSPPLTNYGGTFEYTFTNSGVCTYRVVVPEDPGSGRPGTVSILPWSNTPPAMTIHWPVDGLMVNRIARVPVFATVTNALTNVVHVEFFDNTNLLGRLTNAPFELTWTNLSIGKHDLSAVVTDREGHSQTSRSIRVTALDYDANFIYDLTRLPTGQWRMHYTYDGSRQQELDSSEDLQTWTFRDNIAVNHFGTFVDETATNVARRFYAIRFVPGFAP